MSKRIPAIVTPILDGESCHHSKQDTFNRCMKREKNRIDLIAARCSAMSLLSKINRGDGTEETRSS
eukprot:5406307-Ditylum_brightwellii.AAC.1